MDATAWKKPRLYLTVICIYICFLPVAGFTVAIAITNASAHYVCPPPCVRPSGFEGLIVPGVWIAWLILGVPLIFAAIELQHTLSHRTKVRTLGYIPIPILCLLSLISLVLLTGGLAGFMIYIAFLAMNGLVIFFYYKAWRLGVMDGVQKEPPESAAS